MKKMNSAEMRNTIGGVGPLTVMAAFAFGCYLGNCINKARAKKR